MTPIADAHTAKIGHRTSAYCSPGAGAGSAGDDAYRFHGGVGGVGDEHAACIPLVR
jgi:hypothetical protein